MTNKSGLYQYEGVSVDSKHNTIQIIKDGYFEAARTFRSTRSQELFNQTILIRKQFNQSFNSSIGGTVSNQDGNATTPTVEIAFPANTIVVDGSQEGYQGEVQVAIHYLDPTADEADLVMPGDLSALLVDDILGKATTFGMAYVELQSPSGVRLQIKDGATAELEIKVPSELRSSAPDQVSSSYFDEGLGLWKEEGTATLAGDSYVSEVTHFSCWSYNSSTPSVIVTARLVDQLGLPLPGMHIQLTEQGEWSGGYGYTDQDGVFTGAVAKDAMLNMIVRLSTFCGGTSSTLLTDQVGPFTMDTDMGDIAISLQNTETITVNASFFNCDGDPVTNGLVYVARSYFKITDGTLNVTIPVLDCNPSNFVMWAHDLDTDKVSLRLPLVLGVNNYEDQTLCDIEANFFEVIADGLDINERSMTEIAAIGLTADKTLHAFYNIEGGADWNAMQIDFNDGNANGFTVGTWSISEASIKQGAFVDDLAYMAMAGAGEVDVQVVANDGQRDYIKGSYRVDFTDVTTGVVYEFTGKFKLY